MHLIFLWAQNKIYKKNDYDFITVRESYIYVNKD